MGFLFGFPKSRAELSRLPTSTPTSFGENTNLEEVSDWLTKIIVGLGLVQFDKIRTFVEELGESVSHSITPEVSNGSETIAIAAMLYGFVCGFLFYYVWARTRLYEEFIRRANQAPKADNSARPVDQGIAARSLVGRGESAAQ